MNLKTFYGAQNFSTMAVKMSGSYVFIIVNISCKNVLENDRIQKVVTNVALNGFKQKCYFLCISSENNERDR